MGGSIRPCLDVLHMSYLKIQKKVQHHFCPTDHTAKISYFLFKVCFPRRLVCFTLNGRIGHGIT